MSEKKRAKKPEFKAISLTITGSNLTHLSIMEKMSKAYQAQAPSGNDELTVIYKADSEEASMLARVKHKSGKVSEIKVREFSLKFLTTFFYAFRGVGCMIGDEPLLIAGGQAQSLGAELKKRAEALQLQPPLKLYNLTQEAYSTRDVLVLEDTPIERGKLYRTRHVAEVLGITQDRARHHLRNLYDEKLIESNDYSWDNNEDFRRVVSLVRSRLEAYHRRK